MNHQIFLRNNPTADLIGVKHNTLAVWRTQGKGPAFLKIGRKVLYDKADVIFWLEKQKRTSTTDKGNQI